MHRVVGDAETAQRGLTERQDHGVHLPAAGRTGTVAVGALLVVHGDVGGFQHLAGLPRGVENQVTLLLRRLGEVAAAGVAEIAGRQDEGEVALEPSVHVSDNINSARNLIDTYAVIIKSNIVLNDVIEQLGLDMTYRQLLACISVDGVGSTQIMSITVTNKDPALAGKIVQAIAETAPDVIVDKVEAGSCKVVSDVEITSNPVFPQTKKYVLIAALGGIVAACGILVLDHLLHDYIVDSEDIQKKLELPVLGLIPEV